MSQMEIQIGVDADFIIARDSSLDRSTSIDVWRVLNPGRCRPHLSPATVYASRQHPL